MHKGELSWIIECFVSIFTEEDFENKLRPGAAISVIRVTAVEQPYSREVMAHKHPASCRATVLQKGGEFIRGVMAHEHPASCRSSNRVAEGSGITPRSDGP